MITNRYNKLLARMKKAEQFLDNPNVTMAEKEKYIPEVLKIQTQLSILLEAIGKDNYTIEQALNGFPYVEEGGQ